MAGQLFNKDGSPTDFFIWLQRVGYNPGPAPPSFSALDAQPHQTTHPQLPPLNTAYQPIFPSPAYAQGQPSTTPTDQTSEKNTSFLSHAPFGAPGVTSTHNQHPVPATVTSQDYLWLPSGYNANNLILNARPLPDIASTGLPSEAYSVVPPRVLEPTGHVGGHHQAQPGSLLVNNPSANTVVPKEGPCIYKGPTVGSNPTSSLLVNEDSRSSVSLKSRRTNTERKSHTGKTVSVSTKTKKILT